MSHKITMFIYTAFILAAVGVQAADSDTAWLTMSHTLPKWDRDGTQTIHFSIANDGTFTFEKGKEASIRGAIPTETIDALLAELKAAKSDPGADDTGTLIFRWRDDKGKLVEREFYGVENGKLTSWLEKIQKLVLAHRSEK